ncbi:hypothetical protein GCM10010236_23860 [Streptomyces eurythermus]|nr:hypothetical protein GCM10010236_23860 [Streptomyces eurythermus]
MALVMAQEVPTSSSMAVPHGPAGVGEARHRMRAQLRSGGVAESVIDDAVLILSELLSNACRHGRPLGDAPAGDGDVRAAWRVDARGRLLVEVTDGGGPTRPAPATPSVTAHGGRGLNIITALADDWGVRDDVEGEVTVWVLVHGDVHDPDAGHPHDAFATRVTRPRTGSTPLPDLAALPGVAVASEAARPGAAAAPAAALSGAAAGEVPLPHLPAANGTLPNGPAPDAPRTGISEAALSGIPDTTLTGVPDTRLTGMTNPDTPLSGLTAPGLSLPDLSGLDFADAFEDLD